MSKYVVAVSGGVDSVVLLDMLAKRAADELIVAHFDHGIRAESAADAKFVLSLAMKYGLKFETKREELGENASEELARNRRYAFLRGVAKKYDAQLVTAHHIDDAIETIAINLIRGTGWRGLAAMGSDVIRPLMNMTKAEIINYAQTRGLEWHDDVTNLSDKYLRNRIRRQTMSLSLDAKQQLMALWATQTELKNQIDIETKRLIGKGPHYSRYFLIHLDKKTALEIIRCITEARLTNPQMVKVWQAIKTMKSGKILQAGSGLKIVFSSRNFTVELLK